MYISKESHALSPHLRRGTKNNNRFPQTESHRSLHILPKTFLFPRMINESLCAFYHQALYKALVLMRICRAVGRVEVTETQRTDTLITKHLRAEATHLTK